METHRWSGKELGVGVLGRHRRCCIELDARGGIVRLLADSPQRKDGGGGKSPWIRLGNKRAAVLYHCWVEDMSREVEVKPRKSKPDLNSVHLCFPRHLRQLETPTRHKSASRGSGGQQADCKPRWQGAERVPEPILIRFSVDGGREQEDALCTCINLTARQFAQRRAILSMHLAALLKLQQTPFSADNPVHAGQLTTLWELLMPDKPLPPTNNYPPSPSPHATSAVQASRQPDWGDLGFQNRFCPQSDFRDMGMLSVHLLEYYALRHAGEVSGLIATNIQRQEGYPFAAACINVGHVLVKLLLDGFDASPESVRAYQTEAVGDDPMGPAGILGRLRSPLYLILSRSITDCSGEGASGAGGVVEETFCAAFSLLEQLWVRHSATYMMFNRILGALRECLCLYIQDEWNQPTGSMEALRNFDINRVELSPGPIAPFSRAALPAGAGDGSNGAEGASAAISDTDTADNGRDGHAHLEEHAGARAADNQMPRSERRTNGTPPPAHGSSPARSLESSPVSILYGPTLVDSGAYEGAAYDEKGGFEQYAAMSYNIEALQVSDRLRLQVQESGDEGFSSDAETPPTSVEDVEEEDTDLYIDTVPEVEQPVAWSPTGNMV